MRISLGYEHTSCGILYLLIELWPRFYKISSSVLRVNYDKDVFKIEWDSILVKDISNIKRR